MMSIYWRTFASILTLALLAGCGIAVGGVRSTITRYSDFPSGDLNGSFYVARLDKQNGSVEFGQYARIVEEKLVEQGFQKAINTKNADYVVMIDYGVSGTNQYITNTKNSDGIQKVDIGTEYNRYFNLRMFDLNRSTEGNLIGVYEGTVKSSGSSENFSTVSICMIDALFRDFFKNGTDRRDFGLINKMGAIVTGGHRKCVR